MDVGIIFFKQTIVPKTAVFFHYFVDLEKKVTASAIYKYPYLYMHHPQKYHKPHDKIPQPCLPSVKGKGR